MLVEKLGKKFKVQCVDCGEQRIINRCTLANVPKRCVSCHQKAVVKRMELGEKAKKRQKYAITCPTCQTVRDVDYSGYVYVMNKFGKPERQCRTCAQQKNMVTVVCSECGDERKMSKARAANRKTSLCKSCSYKSRKKTAVKKPKPKKPRKKKKSSDEEISKKAKLIKEREKKLVKMTEEMIQKPKEVELRDYDDKEKALLDAWLEKNKPTVIEPKSKLEDSQTGCQMFYAERY